MANPNYLLPRLTCVAFKSRPSISIAYRHFSQSSRWLASSIPNLKKDQESTSPQQGSTTPPSAPSISNVLANTDPATNPLLTPVHVPEDSNAVLKSDHPAADILTQSAIVVQRQIELMNIMVGFEQANQYVILDPHGNHVGYMAEHDGGIGRGIKRQMLNTHRAFTTHVFDRHAREVLRFDRPFSLVNTRIRVYDPWDTLDNFKTSTSTSLTESTDKSLPQRHVSPVPLESMRVIGETISVWRPLRRKYDLFLSHTLSTDEPHSEPMSLRQAEDLSAIQKQQLTQSTNSSLSQHFAQFAQVDEPFLSWQFALRDEQSNLIGNVSREFRGFGREIFTDTGSYVLQMDAAGNVIPATDQSTNREYRAEQTRQLDLGTGASGMTLDQRAVMLATAVTIDYDYFSRHSGGNAGMLPMVMMSGGEGGAAAGAGAGAGAAEAAGGVAAGGVGRAVATGAGSGGLAEGAMTGAGTMAGYEAMQRGMGRRSEESAADDASPQAPPPDQSYGEPYDPQSDFGKQDQQGDVWGQGDSDPWSEASQSGGSAGGEGGEGGGWMSSLWNSFWDN